MKALILSDIHANLIALEAVLAAAPSFDLIWNLGDTIGYGPRPRECLDLMVDRRADPALVGNHDLACIGALDLSDFNPVAQIASRWTARQLEPRHLAYLKSLPPLMTTHDFTLAHGSPRAPVWEYVTSSPIATANFAHFNTNVCFVGHTHIAMCATFAGEQAVATIQPLRDGDTLDLHRGRLIINPGSVGQPRDRDPRAAFALLDTDRGTVTAHRVDYDISLTQRQMSLANLPDVLISRLAHGI